MKRILILAAGALLLQMPLYARAQEEVALVFKSGYMIRIPYGYGQIADAMKKLRDERHQVIEITINGAPFLLDLAEVVAACKGKCTYLDVVDTRDPARSQRKKTSE